VFHLLRKRLKDRFDKQMARIVMKFGGTSMAGMERIRNVAARVKHVVDQGHEVAVVVSAMAGETDRLVGFCKEASALYDPAEYDVVVAAGEQVTSGLLAMTLKAIGVDARSWLGWQLPIRTIEAHAKARISTIETDALIAAMQSGQVAVIPGFQGMMDDGRVSTLGRGGSDTSAVAVAAAVKADRCDIYTDVDGVYTTDPRIVARARKLDLVTYEEMLELASVGAKVLQTRSVGLAMKEGVVVQVLSSFDDPTQDDLPGTLIVSDEELEAKLKETKMERQLITGIAHDKNEAKIIVTRVPDKPGAVASIFTPLADAAINVDMIIQNDSKDNEDRRHLHCPARGPRPQRRHPGSQQGRDRLPPHHHRHRSRQDQRRGRGHAQPCRRRRHHVQDAGRARHQHRGDLHQRDQGFGADRRGRDRTGGARAAYRLWPRRPGGLIAIWLRPACKWHLSPLPVLTCFKPAASGRGA
jgi:aspartate kinase